ncbi:hypothetical protein [Caballeronia glebae]|uniref:hypothetical protein n=1 Tax=Caballeronia glebae TaxID=1777143 RepID=UPI0038BA9B5D
MENSLDMTQPVALARPRGAHRLEVFSPKLNRRLTFYRRSALEQWILLEADPMVGAFCERPGFIQYGGQRYLAEFWVRYVDREELVILGDSIVDMDASPAVHLAQAELTVRSVLPAELAASRMWIDNWQRMLPYIVANRGLVSDTLSHAIERFLRDPQRLLAIEREFSIGDPILVRAAVFGLLYSGRVRAQSLRTDALSLLTEFVAAEPTP